jgi:hypothetical protein
MTIKTLKSFEFTRLAFARKWDWATLLNGEIHQVSADDGEELPKSFGQQCRSQAKKRGMAVRVNKTTEGDIVVQAVPRPSETDGETPKKKRGRKATAE